MLKRFNKFTALVVVMALVLISCTFIGITTAKYYSKTTGTGSFQTAKWSVKTVFSVDSATKTLIPTERATGYSVTITSTSEVDVEYDIVVTFNVTLPNGVTIELDKDNEDLKRTITSTGGQKTFTFSNVGILSGTNNSATHTISFYVEGDANTDDGVLIKTYTGTIKVVAEQAS